jgi:hypothetical protein
MKTHAPVQGSRSAGGVAPRVGSDAQARGPRAGRGNGFLQEQLARKGAPAPETDAGGAGAQETGTYDAFGTTTGTESAAPARVAGQRMASADTDRLYGAVRATARGASLLERLGDRPLPELSWSGQGSYMLGGNVWLDLELPEREIVDILVHELQHVLNEREGRTGDIANDDRATYVEKTLNDESLAQGAMIVHGLQAGGQGLESKVFNAHLQQVDPTLAAAVAAGGAGVDWEKVETIARAYARTQFEQVYRTSTTGERYPDYYGKSWDRARGAGS